MAKKSFFCIAILFIIANSFSDGSEKIDGVNFVSPNRKDAFTNFNSLTRISADWVAFNPYAFSKANEPAVTFNYERSWWGEKTDGIVSMINEAKKSNLKVMLKPHVWVMGEGWCGNFDLATEKEWKTWEEDYEKYILTYAKIAAENNVELLCIGTEYKISTTKRVLFWKQLIGKIRKIYKGKVTYAANWDNFHNIKFWEELDYVGIDAYFPLSSTKEANKKELNLKWQKVSETLEQFSKAHQKQIIFTEYGYKSTHYTAWKQWEIERVKRDELINFSAQNNAYSSLYENIWNQAWFGGGFIWKWYPNDKNSGGEKNSDYTPQHKPVEKIIKQYYQ
jgi:Glycoside Hydrolase Family 113